MLWRAELERRLAAVSAERDAYLHQRDEALGERNELRRQLDIAIGERNEYLCQRDIAIGNEYLRQRDIAIGERNVLQDRVAKQPAFIRDELIEVTVKERDQAKYEAVELRVRCRNLMADLERLTRGQE
jgi:hypothetical protein